VFACRHTCKAEDLQRERGAAAAFGPMRCADRADRDVVEFRTSG